MQLVTLAGTAAASSNRGGGTKTADGSDGEQQQQVPHRLPVHVGQQGRQPGPSRGFARCSVVGETAELQLSGASGQSLKAGFCGQCRPRQLVAEQSRAGLRWKKRSGRSSSEGKHNVAYLARAIHTRKGWGLCQRASAGSTCCRRCPGLAFASTLCAPRWEDQAASTRCRRRTAGRQLRASKTRIWETERNEEEQFSKSNSPVLASLEHSPLVSVTAPRSILAEYRLKAYQRTR
jgi:hypothetical protein